VATATSLVGGIHTFALSTVLLIGLLVQLLLAVGHRQIFEVKPTALWYDAHTRWTPRPRHVARFAVLADS